MDGELSFLDTFTAGGSRWEESGRGPRDSLSTEVLRGGVFALGETIFCSRCGRNELGVFEDVGSLWKGGRGGRGGHTWSERSASGTG